MNTLLDAVDDLTKPEHQHIAQKDDSGRWLKAHTVTHPPLLQRMHDAVQPSSNRTAGSASSASTRSPIDLDALFEYAKMTSQIRDWCRIEGVVPHRDPVAALRQWYVARFARPEEDHAWYTRRLTGWARTIRDHLNPPETFTVRQPCPVCGAEGWGDQINGGDTWPIEVRYRLTDERMTDEMALCRPCKTVWEGADAVRELAEELDERTGTA